MAQYGGNNKVRFSAGTSRNLKFLDFGGNDVFFVKWLIGYLVNLLKALGTVGCGAGGPLVSGPGRGAGYVKELANGMSHGRRGSGWS
jgi:hypothetical protein